MIMENHICMIIKKAGIGLMDVFQCFKDSYVLILHRIKTFELIESNKF